MHCVHHILMEETEGQDVVLNILEVFVNRWRHVLANVTSLCPESGERKRIGWKQYLISNGTKDIKIDRKTEKKIRDTAVVDNILYSCNSEQSFCVLTVNLV